ncbi:hypothetical protein H0H87_006108 [Tephrocybe sp. NHM501043]|nr:hypothetical protein H0H87_006108 [Tephrocybe sp. NHM501043]
MKLTAFAFICGQLSRVAPVEKADVTGKTVMVLGANTGIGFEATKHFALMNPMRLILACRSRSKGDAAVEKLQRETGYKGAELWLVDLNQFASIVAFADKFEKQGGRLDILVENATLIVLEVLFYQAVNERLGAQSPVIINGVNPGLCYSELRRDISGISAWSIWIMEKFLARTSEEGSRQLVWAAVGGKDDEDKLRGAYVDGLRIVEASDFAVGEEGHVVQDKLWREVLHILGKVDHRVTEIAREYLSQTA